MLESVSRVVSAITTRSSAGTPPGSAACSPRTATCASSSRSAPTSRAATPDADRALALLPRIDDFLRQAVDEPSNAADTWASSTT